MAMLASQGAVHESTPSIEQRKRRELHDYDDTPCQAPASDFNHDEANKRHELKIQRQDQKRFQQRQQAKFNTKGRR